MSEQTEERMKQSPSDAAAEYSFADFGSLLAERVRQGLRDLYAGIPNEAFLWAAIAPEWSIPLAEACGLPAGKVGVAAVFNRFVEGNLMRACPLTAADDEMWMYAPGGDATALVDVARSSSEVGAPPAPAMIYEMENDARAAILKSFTAGLDDPLAFVAVPTETAKLSEHGYKRLRSEHAAVGRAMMNAREIMKHTTPRTWMWAKLAAESIDGSRMAQVFDEHINAAYARRNAAEILDWIDAARPLALLLKSDLDARMDIALVRASRRVELLHREEHDRRHLATLLPRNEQRLAFAALMNDEGASWALHFIGAGGVGKTMLVRDINLNLASEHGAVTARIDFDYLNADYPSLSPGVLLDSFAEELRVYDKTGRATELFEKADYLLDGLSERLQVERNSQPLLALTRPEFVEAVKLYIDAFRTLGQRVLLIVDTCEELARIRPDGTVPDSVEATFRILSALHDGPGALFADGRAAGEGLPDLRVVFAGRRLLASSGAGWHAAESELPPRPFLRLHEIRGFTHDEARRYLVSRKVDEKLFEPIIRRSPDVGSVISVKQEAAPADDPAEFRCNPYELKFNADWATGDPRPTPGEIENASDVRYVQLRIIGRLRHPPLERLLPVVALLGHFDQEMLSGIAGLDEETFEDTFRRLRQQEWIVQRRAASGSTTRIVFVMERGVRQRLLAYYRVEGRGELRHARQRAADYLERVTLERDLGELDWSYFDAALSVLEDDAYPSRAAVWWERVERRIVGERGYAWGLNVIGYLCGDDGAAAPRDPKRDPQAVSESCLRAAVLATYASALLHEGKHREASAAWRETGEKAARHPVPEVAARLRLRAVAGEIAATKYTDDLLLTGRVNMLWDEIAELDPATLDDQTTASVIAGVEAIIEHAENLRPGHFGTFRSLIGSRDYPLLAVHSLKDAPSFILKLRDEGRPPTAFLFSLLSAELHALLRAYDPAQPPPRRLLSRLVSELNEIFLNKRLFEQEAIAGLHPNMRGFKTKLDAETTEFGKTMGLLTANRLVVDFICPGELAGAEEHEMMFVPEPLLLARVIEGAHQRWQEERGKGNATEQEQLVAFAYSLAARACVLLRKYKEADDWFTKAIERADTDTTFPTSHSTVRWQDWLPPDDTAARMHLEFARAMYPRFLPPKLTIASIYKYQDLGSPKTIDAERLLSMLLRLRLATAPVEPETLAQIGWTREHTLGILPPLGLDLNLQCRPDSGSQSCNALNMVPPLFVVAAEALASTGRAGEALRTLRHVSRDASEYPLAIVLHAERALARIERRLRLRDIGARDGGSLLDSPDVDDRRLMWALDVLDGPKNQKPIPVIPAEVSDAAARRAWLHAIWQTRTALDEHGASEALRWSEDFLPDIAGFDGNSDFFTISLYFDFQEAAELADRFGFSNDPVWKLAHPRLSSRRAKVDELRSNIIRSLNLTDASLSPEHRFTIYLRIFDLLYQTEKSHQYYNAIYDLADQLGLRRAAEIALDHGEMLALRLPERAIASLGISRQLFTACGDDAGVFISVIMIELLIAAQPDAMKMEFRLRSYDPRGGLLPKSPGEDELFRDPIYTSYDRLAQRLSTSPEVNASGKVIPPPIPSRETLIWLTDTFDIRVLALLTPAAADTNALPAKADNTTAAEDNRINCALEWRPWVVRMFACIFRWEADSENGAVRLDVFRQWLENHYGEVVGGRYELPAELSVFIRKITGLSKPSGEVATDEPKLVSHAWRVLKTALTALVCLVLFLVISVGAYLLLSVLRIAVQSFVVLLNPAAGGLTEQESSNSFGRAKLISLFIVCAGLAGIWFSTRVWKYLRRRGAPPGVRPGRKATGFFRAWEKFIFAALIIFVFGSGFAAYGGFSESAAAVYVGLALFGFGILLMLVAVVLAFIAGIRNVRSFLLSKYVLVVNISPARIVAGREAEAQTKFFYTLVPPLIEWIPDFILIFIMPLTKIFMFLARLPETAKTYRQFALACPVEMNMEFARLRALLGSRTMDVIVEPSEGLHGACWEALFAFAPASEKNKMSADSVAAKSVTAESVAANQIENFDPDTLRVRRTGKRRKRAPQKLEGEMMVLSWPDTVVTRSIVQRGWSALGGRLIEIGDAPEIEGLSETPERVRVLHLIGTTEATTNELRLRLQGEPVRSRKASIKASLKASSRMTRPANRYARAEDIERVFPNLMLCVLQAEPRAQDAERLESDRNDAALYRRLAAEIYARGIPAVIVLPPLDANLGVKVIEPIAACLRRGSGVRTMHLHAAVTEARAVILSAPSPDPESRAELALDLCLYIADDLGLNAQ